MSLFGSAARLAARFEPLVSAPEDTGERRSQKAGLALTSVLIIPASLVWGTLYLAYGEFVAAAIPYGYAVLTLAGLAVVNRTRRFAVFQNVQFALAVLLPFALQLALGGFVGGSAVILWGFMAPIVALLFCDERTGVKIFGAYILTVVVAGLVQPFVRIQNLLSLEMILVFFVLNVGTVSTVAFAALTYFVRERHRLRQLEVAYLDQEVMLRESEKLATLGTLAAGIAHELNNPSAAAIRGAERLRPLFAELRRDYLGAGSAKSAEVAQLLSDTPPQAALSPLERSDHEEVVADWLAERGVDDAWALAPSLVEAGLGPDRLRDLEQAMGSAALVPLLAWTARSAEADQLIGEIGEGARRISSIVAAMRSYSYVDQASLNEVDVVEGLESTLVLLQSRLKHGVEVVREYEPDLPHITAYGSELNQVWTNLIANAIDAMDGAGQLTVRTARAGHNMMVEVEDDGPGVPPDAIGRVFDPFFTTKPPGQGTGLGLNISHGIVVNKHGGTIAVDSQPGRTTFRVSLPIDNLGDHSAK